MKILSLDLETSSLEPHTDNILMLSGVVEDLNDSKLLGQLPQFTVFIRRQVVTGQPYALAMNKWILDIISGKKKTPKGFEVIEPSQLCFRFENFIHDNFGYEVKATLAGKNVGVFDLQFLPKSMQNLFNRRVLDVGTLWLDPAVDDEIPNIKTCLKRAGLPEKVTHHAYEDALQTISLIRAWQKLYYRQAI